MVIPQTTATLTLTSIQIDELPVGATYQAKDGNASGTVRKTEENNIEFTANCDSLLVLIEELNKEVYHFQAENTALKTELMEQKIEVVKEPTGWQWFQIYGFWILVLYELVRILLKRFKLKKQ